MAHLPEKYRILEKIGEGGMGEVYRAEDTLLRRNVAIKIISGAGRNSQSAQARFLREARAASAFSHPCIATIYEMGESAEGAYIVMEYVEGCNLREFIRGGPMRPDVILEFAVQICTALEEAHAHGVIHRDIKPENILVTKRNRVKLVDFGLAKWLPSEMETHDSHEFKLSHSGAIIGTPAYMSPEQIRGEELDARTDLFALGVMLHEMILGRLPFTGATALEMAASVLRDPVKTPTENQSGVTREMALVVERCLEKDREQRFATAAEVREALEKLRHDLELLDVLDTHHLAARPAAPLPEPATPTILVLPFDAVGGDVESAVFAIGLTHALITDLARIPGLSVLSKTAGDSGHKGHSAAQSARELGATILLEGEVLRAGEAIAVMARVSDVHSGRVLWGTRYRGNMTDVFGIHDEVCRNVAHALELNLSTDLRNRISRPATKNVEAFDAYSRGRALLERRDIKENIPAAIMKFEEAIRLDPDFALAYAALGEASWRHYQATHDASWVQRAVSACDHALILDPSQALVHVSLGITYFGTGRTDKAIEEFERALKLQPACDDAYKWLGRCWERMGELSRAVDAFKHAISIRKYWDHYLQLGYCYYASGQYKDAAEQFREVIALQPDNYTGYNNLGAMYYLMGLYAEATEILKQALKINPTWDAWSNLGSTYFYMERYQEAIAAYEAALKLDPESAVCHRNLGDAFLRRGEIQDATREYSLALNLYQQDTQTQTRNGEAFADLAVCQAKLGQRKDAAESIARALDIEPGNSSNLYSKAVVEALLGETELALASLRQALACGYSAFEAYRDPDLGALRNSAQWVNIFPRVPQAQ